jgi:hypothetical protein
MVSRVRAYKPSMAPSATPGDARAPRWVAAGAFVLAGVVSACGDPSGAGCPTCAADASLDVRDGSIGDSASAHDAAADTIAPSDALADAAWDAQDRDALAADGSSVDAPSGDAGLDAGASDAGSPEAAASDAGTDSGSGADAANEAGIITGGPCLSGAPGATAFRVRWIDAGGQAQVVYEAYGLPDTTNESAGAYGYQIGFVPQFVDMFLAQGGLALDSSDFVDLGMSTVGLVSITSATISVYGRSYDVTTNGSFNWMSFTGSSSTATDAVSNVPPYQWYSGDLLSAIDTGDNHVLIRTKAGPSSNALVVNAIEICLAAQ